MMKIEEPVLPDEVTLALVITDILDELKDATGRDYTVPELVGGLLVMSCGIENIDAIREAITESERRLTALRQ